MSSGFWHALARIDALASQGDWNVLQSSAETFCREHSGADAANAIAAEDLSAYIRQLEELSHTARGEAAERTAAAVYFEFDLDNAWSSHMLVCSAYNPKSAGDDDWAAAWDSALAGPKCEALARHYDSSFGSTNSSAGRSVLLVARTLEAIARATEWWSPELPLCAGYHDQDSLTRLRSVAG